MFSSFESEIEKIKDDEELNNEVILITDNQSLNFVGNPTFY
jgi:hypothetical protein